MTNKIYNSLLMVTCLFSLQITANEIASKDDVASPEAITLAIHRWASVEAGESRDNTLLFSLITETAYIVYFKMEGKVRKQTTISLKEIFLNKEQLPFKEGYLETVTNMRVERTDHAANVWADYEIRNTKSGPVVKTGVTNLQLFYDGSRWWILGWHNILTS